MDTLNVNTIEPEGGTTTINVGLSGKNVIITDNLKANTLKDAGGNTIFTSNGSGVLSSVNSGFGSAQVLLSTQTASNSASIEFTSGIDSTYKEYVFDLTNIVPVTDNVDFKFEISIDAGSSYGVSQTTTNFSAIHNEDDGYAALSYQAGMDLANSTNPQTITWGNTPNNDGSLSGEVHLFNPSSTTYVKNWYLRTQQKSTNPRSQDQYAAGYVESTSAVTGIKFIMSSGNISAGTFKMYGIK